MYKPTFQITPAITKLLMDTEASRRAVASLPVPAAVLTSLRKSARLASTHYSTQIEGNRLTREQVEEVLQGATFPNRERDEREVKNHHKALDYLHELIAKKAAKIDEKSIQTLHGLVFDGKKKATPYRDGQNVIRDSGTNAIVYLPPEAKDVLGLMSDLVDWINTETDKKELPVPLIAAIAHYQCAVIHPHYDGNGRTARLLTDLVLHQSGYGLKGIYSLEEYYAKNLPDYYRALNLGESHNYYFGSAVADITPWLTYFCEGMADAFAKIHSKVVATSQVTENGHRDLLRKLDHRQRQVLSLFEQSERVTTREVADLLKIHKRTALGLCNKWCDEGFLVRHGTAPKSRKYELADRWLELLK